MPYIPKSSRSELRPESPAASTCPGDLTFQIQQLIKDYWERMGPSYDCIVEIWGALTGAKFDFDFSVVEDYERRKRRENGDVW